MATALDVITRAFNKIGVYAAGETISDADAQAGLTILNDMLDSWSNESLSCFAILEQTGTLQVGVSSYTIGTGGVFNMTRPLRLLEGPGTAYLLDSNNDKFMMDVVPRDRWNLISQPNIDADLPNTIFYDPQFPLGIINVWPAPNLSYPMYWDSYLQLSDFAALTTVVSLPPGYKKALQDNLAIELVPDYKPDTFQIPAHWTQAAALSKGNIKRTNIRTNEAEYDPELVAKANGTYNIYNDSFTR